MSAQLRRFWFKFDSHPRSPLGYGVTAWTEDDAVAILSQEVFGGARLPKLQLPLTSTCRGWTQVTFSPIWRVPIGAASGFRVVMPRVVRIDPGRIARKRTARC